MQLKRHARRRRREPRKGVTAIEHGDRVAILGSVLLRPGAVVRNGLNNGAVGGVVENFDAEIIGTPAMMVWRMSAQ